MEVEIKFSNIWTWMSESDTKLEASRTLLSVLLKTAHIPHR